MPLKIISQIGKNFVTAIVQLGIGINGFEVQTF